MPLKNKCIISVIVIIVIVAAFGAVILFSQKPAVINDEVSDTSAPDAFAKGVSLSPRSYEASDFTDFFEKAEQAGTLVSWAGDWKELNNTQAGPVVVASLASTYGYLPVIEVQFFSQSNGALLRPLDDANMEAYRDWAVAFVTKYNVKYLALGIEVNMLYEKAPADFDRFVQLFNEVYDAVKAQSAQTQVFTVFQLEKMKGLNGGLFGGSNDPAVAHWTLLDRLAKSDLIAFTTYPGLIYTTPDQIPADYYTEIKLHTTKPVAFTEIGWHTEAPLSGWESSEAEQSEFVTKFFTSTSSLNKEMTIWSFLYDQNTAVPFNSMGLWRSDGTAKLAWNTWISVK